MSHIPANRHLEAVQGVTFTHKFLWEIDGEPEDLTDGYTASLKIKSSMGGAAALTLTHSAGLTLADDGTILVTITDEQTLALDARNYFYTLDVTKSGAVTRLAESRLEVRRG